MRFFPSEANKQNGRDTVRNKASSLISFTSHNPTKI